jgi:hypothetical protein
MTTPADPPNGAADHPQPDAGPAPAESAGESTGRRRESPRMSQVARTAVKLGAAAIGIGLFLVTRGRRGPKGPGRA